MICRVPRAEPAASPRRPELRISRAILKPCPTSPKRLAAGTRTFSKITERVSDALIPIFSSSLPERDAGRVALDDERRHPLLLLAVDLDRDLGEDGEQPGVAGVGDPDLRPVQDVLRAVGRWDRGALHRLRVGAGAGLGQAEGGDQFARGAAREVLLLLLLGAEEHDPLAADGLVGAEVDGERRVGGADLAEDAVEDLGAGAEAAVRLGDVEPHEAQARGSPRASRPGSARRGRACWVSMWSFAKERKASRMAATDSFSSARSGREGEHHRPRGSRRGRAP